MAVDHPTAASSLDALLIDARHTSEQHADALASAQRDGNWDLVHATEAYAMSLLARLGAHASTAG